MFLDAASGAEIVTLTDNVEIKSITCTGFTGQLVIGATPFTLTINGGGFVYPSSAQTLANFGFITFSATSGSYSVSSSTGGLGSLNFTGVGGSWTLNGSNFDVNNISHTGGTITIGNNGSVGSLSSTGSNVRAIDLGSYSITFKNSASYTDPVTFSGSNLTLTGGTSTLTFETGSSAIKTFTGGGKTFNNITIPSGASSSGNRIIFAGSNTFNTFTIANQNWVKFTAGTTQTITSFVMSGGSAGSESVIASTSGGSQFTLSSTSSSVEYADVSDSLVIGTAKWVATNSVNSGNNNGWHFNTTPGEMFNLFDT